MSCRANRNHTSEEVVLAQTHVGTIWDAFFTINGVSGLIPKFLSLQVSKFGWCWCGVVPWSHKNPANLGSETNEHQKLLPHNEIQLIHSHRKSIQVQPCHVISKAEYATYMMWCIFNYPLVICYIAMENCPFIDGLPIQDCDFPWH